MAYDDRDSSESENEWTELKSLVLSHLSGVQTAGSFCTSGSFKSLVLPGILVEGVGVIGLPLSSRDAQSLIRSSRQAPFGKNGRTLVDETVRKTWEIEGSKVSFTNEAWHGWLEDVVRTAARDLGVAGGPESVRAELYKMLLYENGAMFKPHQDTEKISGMFGTLIICLPSEHIGGTVRLIHGQETKTLDTAQLSAFNTTYLAWYADVTHEVEPVQSGFRWVLTYNLINSSSSLPQSAAGLDDQVAPLLQTLVEWRKFDDGAQCLCYALSHRYTATGLKLASLKGSDFYRTRYIAEACRKAGDFYALLASMQEVVTIMNDEGGECEENRDFELQLHHISDLEGFTLRESLVIPETFLLSPWLYESRDPDAQNGGEYMGNQHADINEYYNDKVLLIVPKALATDFLLGHKHTLADFKVFLEDLQRCFKAKKSEHIRELIVQTCQRHLKKAYTDDRSKDLFLGPIAIAAIAIADQALFRSSVNSVTDGFDQRTFYALGEFTGFPRLVVPEEDLLEAFSKVGKFYELRRCLQAFRDGFSKTEASRSDEHQTHLTSWVKDKLSQALKSTLKVYPQDAAALIETAKEYDETMIKDLIKPFIAQYVTDSNFSNSLAVEMLSFSRSSNPDKDLIACIVPLVLNAATDQFELQKYSSAAKNSSHREDYPYSSWPGCYDEAEKGRLDAGLVIGLYQQLLQSDEKKAAKLLVKIQSQTNSLLHRELDRLIIPLIEQMLEVLDLDSLETRRFYQSIMTTYITRVVQREPEKPSDWARPNELSKCECSDCISLNEFLMDPGEESRSFILPKKSWHLGCQVPWQCKSSEDKSQKPPVLTVTKTLKAWEADHPKWQKRAAHAQKNFKRLHQQKLQQCLAGEYDAIMELPLSSFKMGVLPARPPANRRRRGREITLTNPLGPRYHRNDLGRVRDFVVWYPDFSLSL